MTDATLNITLEIMRNRTHYVEVRATCIGEREDYWINMEFYTGSRRVDDLITDHEKFLAELAIVAKIDSINEQMREYAFSF